MGSAACVLERSRGARGASSGRNFVGTIAVDTLGIVLAGLGFLNPLLAAFIHVASEMTFILNSARLLPGAERVATPAAIAMPAGATRAA